MYPAAQVCTVAWPRHDKIAAGAAAMIERLMHSYEWPATREGVYRRQQLYIL